MKIIVVTHKDYEMPKDDLYLPIQVGRGDDLGHVRDNTGENICEKNPYFCELTALYWAWKNLEEDYVGMVHYRRHLASSRKKSKNKMQNVLSFKEVTGLLETTDVILPKKRKYYIETIYSHYAHTMHIEPLDITGEIIEEKYPEYSTEFELLKKRTSAHAFNIFVMKKDVLDKYCEWLFDVLFELEKRVDVEEYDDFHKRFFGRVSEWLLDVWLNTNKISYMEVGLIDVEGVNWLKKGSAFLRAKFFGKKYRGSF